MEATLKKLESPDDLAALRDRIVASRDSAQPGIVVCGGTGCRSAGSLQLADALSEEMKKNGLDGKVGLKLSGCHGLCQEGPVVIVEPQGLFYRVVGRDDPKRDAKAIVEQTLIGGKPVEELLYNSPSTGKAIPKHEDIPFYAKQTRVVLRNNGKIDPFSVEDYIAAGGYSAMAKAMAMDPDEIISSIDRSGLRGRGGGGFPTGRKWRFCRDAADKSMRYIICNADEGDPGAFMDRSIIEGDPHAVIEGMVIGALAIARGVSPAEGCVYIRAEYPLAIETLTAGIRQAEELGLLGDGILGTDLNFHIKVKQGAGAFVCGEETALMASIEGRRGMPRIRPPFPAQSGLYGKPTNINNVETWASVSRILEKTPEWYAGIGTPTSKGTKVFSLVGKVTNSGLIEVPMGITLREIIFDIGGGTLGGKPFKAVQTGGPSGGCLPESALDLPVDYDSLAEAGSIMGSGGMIVIDEDTCIVDLARYFISFTKSESCGKCAPCRLGTWQMYAILNDMCEGRASPEDLTLIKEIAESVKAASLCGLGQTAPNPVITTMHHFSDEYEAHVRDGRCPAGVCQSLRSYTIDPEKCTACGACRRKCPVNAITGEKKVPHVIDAATCTRCGTCFDVCRFDAVKVD
jgi:NADH:ubiquinone oxidoreductase subunit F (NADH-binding)/(2Fe-2S) ferredoxin/Pyruvate/2-oxoacid:ferredoxin oxidoreductase delta subunit